MGDFADADHYLLMAIDWRTNTLGKDDPKITDDMLQDVALCRGMKDYGRALEIVNAVLLRHSKAFKFESVEVADDYSRLAQILLEQKKPEDAIVPLETALAIRTKLGGPLDPSLVYDLDRLGAVQTALRAYDKAEEAFRHALVIRESLYGKNHADLIATVDGLAYAYFGEEVSTTRNPSIGASSTCGKGQWDRTIRCGDGARQGRDLLFGAEEVHRPRKLRTGRLRSARISWGTAWRSRLPNRCRKGTRMPRWRFTGAPLRCSIRPTRSTRRCGRRLKNC